MKLKQASNNRPQRPSRPSNRATLAHHARLCSHDLGGREGFGAIDVHETEVLFHEPWVARVLGIVRAMSPAADWSIGTHQITLGPALEWSWPG
jgi:hypothetical protein